MNFYYPNKVGVLGFCPTREDEADESMAAGKEARQAGKPREVPDEYHPWSWRFGYDSEDEWINSGGAEGFLRRWAAKKARERGESPTEVLCRNFDMITGRAGS